MRIKTSVPLIFLATLTGYCSGSGTITNDTGGSTSSITNSITTVATRVYGQAGSFSSNVANNGGLSANTLNVPYGISTDATGVYVADHNNNRVLFFSGAATTATRVYGQASSFSSSTANNGGISATSLSSPWSVTATGSGVYIADRVNSRVLYYAGTSITATRVYGQAGSYSTNTQNAGGLSADSLNYPNSVAVDAGGIYVADMLNHRVLYFSGTATTATRVYGQAGSFTTNTANNGGISANSLNLPTFVATDGTGVYIADNNNHRVLYYSGTSTTATRVYGQAGSFTTGTSNNGGISANSLQYPNQLVLTATGLYVSDSQNCRVLYYSGTSTTASQVYGQGGNFTTNTVNNGGVSGSSLQYPVGIAIDSNGKLYIADSSNHRILFF